MRTEEEIKERVSSLLKEEIERQTKDASERLPHKCVHNYRHNLDVRKQVDGDVNDNYNRIVSNGGSLPVLQTIGLCMLGSESPEEWGGTICEDPLDAKRCPYFTPEKTKDDIQNTLIAQVRDPSWRKANMPEVQGLFWALGYADAQQEPQVEGVIEEIQTPVEASQVNPDPPTTKQTDPSFEAIQEIQKQLGALAARLPERSNPTPSLWRRFWIWLFGDNQKLLGP